MIYTGGLGLNPQIREKVFKTKRMEISPANSLFSDLLL